MARVLSAVAMLAICGACGRSPVLDVDRLEADIPVALAPRTPDAITDVDCPDLVVKGPRDVVCTASIGGVAIDVSVSISAEDQARVSTGAVVVEVAGMESAAADRLSTDLGVATTVACPGPPIVVSVPGLALACDAVDTEGEIHPVTLTIRTDDGEWELSLG